MVEVKLGLGETPRPGNGHAEPQTALLPGAEPDVRVVVDKRGRKLVVRRPELLAEFHFIEAVGGELAENTRWMGMAMPLIYLAEMAGQPAPILRTKLGIEAVLKELGTDGYKAMLTAIQDIIKDDDKEEEIQVKNS